MLARASRDGSLAAAVAARLARQEALHDPARSFEFVMTEAALRYRPGTPDILAIADGGLPAAALTQQALTGQLDHLAAVVTAEHLLRRDRGRRRDARHHPLRLHPL